jgi:beta-glucosidase/6-phospho-beta-glucosidase/beta-galactosidase
MRTSSRKAAKKLATDTVLSKDAGKLLKLMKYTHALDLMLQEEFSSFIKVGNAIDFGNAQILEAMKRDGHACKRLNNLRSQQQYDMVVTGEIWQRIDNILQRRSDSLNEIVGLQHRMSKRVGE